MRGPVPKDPSTLRRAGARAGVERLPAEGRDGPVPSLPERWDLLPDTLAWWEAVCRSPMASRWLDVDFLTLAQVAPLVDLIYRGEASAAVHAEVRQAEDRFGLSVASRARLRWVVGETPPAPVRALPLRRPDPRISPRNHTEPS